jgi:hypothetical protein
MDAEYQDIEAVVDQVIAKRGRRLKVAFPLGLGKPVHLANALLERLEQGEIETL